MNLLLAAAEKAAEKSSEGGSPFDEVITHLSPHHYSWAPDWKIGAIDLSFTNAVLNIWIAAGLVLVLFMIAANKPKIVPSGVQNLVEGSIDWLKTNIVYAVMSPKDGAVWFPFIATFFFFILFMNTVGLIPVIGFTPTSNIFVTATLALMVYLTAVVVGVAKHGFFTFWKKTLVPPGVPKVLQVLMAILIEPVSQIARPFSLAVRLFANMLADHLLLLIFVGFIFLSSGAVAIAVLPFALAFEIVFTAFGLMVAFIQAAIFAFLTTLYLNDALHPGH